MSLHASVSGPTRFEHYTGSLVEDNYVWSGAMNLCWTALCETVIHAPVVLHTTDPAALATTDHLNHPVCSKADLDEPSYYVMAGFGQRTVQIINEACREKFPRKTFADLDLDLREEEMVSYAYFVKNVRYEKPFTRRDVFFEGTRVKGFEADEAQKKTVEVLHYENDDRFFLRLRLKEKGDELILAKGFDTRYPADVLQALASIPASSSSPMGKDDHFNMPLLKLNCRRDYAEMTGQPLANSGFTSYVIGLMYENIAFELDETGAKAESEAVLSVVRGAYNPHQQDRYFYLNKPFWVILKRADSVHPYFLLGVRHTNLMQTN